MELLLVILLALNLVVGIPAFIRAAKRGYARKSTVRRLEGEKAELEASNLEISNLLMASVMATTRARQAGLAPGTRVTVTRRSNLRSRRFTR